MGDYGVLVRTFLVFTLLMGLALVVCGSDNTLTALRKLAGGDEKKLGAANGYVYAVRRMLLTAWVLFIVSVMVQYAITYFVN